MKLRAFPFAATVAAALALTNSSGEARVLQVDPAFTCPDDTVCDCPGAPESCFRFTTIVDAMAAAVASDSILVRGGFYSESVGIKSGVQLLGGWDATFTSRNPGTNVTTIDGGNAVPPVFSGNGVGDSTLVDGFTISGGGGYPGCGVLIRGGAPRFRNNRIVNNVFPGLAGGVYISEGSSAVFENNVIADNSTEGSGAGVRVDFSSATLTGNTIERNEAGHSGAGIYVVGGSVVASGNTIRDNISGDGGGGGAYLQEASAATSFTGNDFTNNTGAYGGAVMMKDQSTATFQDNDFSSNIASQSGGGIAVFGQSEITLTSNRFQDCRAQTSGGGGVFVLSSEVNLTGSDATTPTPDASFVNCTATGSGGGFYAYLSSGVISGVRFHECESDSLGGALFVGRSLFTISENLIVDCTALDAGGLAIYFNNESNETPTVCPVLSNTLYGCSVTSTFETAGGIGLFANGRDEVIAELAGNIIAFTRQGSALRCKRAPPGPNGPADAVINCSTFHLDPGNPTLPEEVVTGGDCNSRFFSGLDNSSTDPKFCSPVSLNFALQNCPAPKSCKPAGGPGDNRGVPYPSECGCQIFSVDASSWGRIKASYR